VGKLVEALPFLQKETVSFHKRPFVRWVPRPCTGFLLYLFDLCTTKNGFTLYLQLANGKKINLQATADGWIPVNCDRQF